MELLHQYGYALVFFVILLEQLGLPIPAAPIMILAGALAAGGELSFSLVVLFASIGCLIGDFVWYFFGRYKGRRVLKTLCSLSLSPESCVQKTESSFAKYGMNSLIFAKFVPGLNTIAPPMAGLVNSSFPSFLWRDLLGTYLYVLAFTIPGFFFEKAVFDITSLFEEIGRTSLAIVVAGLAAYVLFKFARLKILQRMLYKQRIAPEELYRRISEGENLIILDLRNPATADPRIRIPGSLRIIPGEIDQNLHLLDKEKPIVMYCT
jgi:membrane protein DedA with SNARE-associated domain